jgi:hypothetical protein
LQRDRASERVTDEVKSFDAETAHELAQVLGELVDRAGTILAAGRPEPA